MFRCRGENRCIWQEQVCDGIYDCPMSHDDELLCTNLILRCPDGCHCLGQALDCSSRNLSDYMINRKLGEREILRHGNLELKVNKRVRAVLLSENHISRFPEAIAVLFDVYRLNMSRNEMTSIGGDILQPALRELYLHENNIVFIEGSPFSKVNNLIILTLYGNRIASLSANNFYGLDKLPILDLSYQIISESLPSNAFHGLHSAHTINVSHNIIDTLNDHAFMNKMDGKNYSFDKLKYFDISHNELGDANPQVFEELGTTVALFTDRYKWCCFAVNVRRCEPQPDEFSSCTHLIASRTMHLFVWGMGVLSFFGNLIILQQRIKHERETTISIMVQHLAFSDMMMGAYLLIIAGADSWYKNVFILYTDAWLDNPVCKVAAFLYQTSAEMSLFIMVILVCDRMYAMLPGCNAHGMNLKSAKALAALGWIASAILGMLPYLQLNYFANATKSETAICIMFNLTYGRRISTWEYFLCIFIIYNMFCVVLMGVGYTLVTKSVHRGLGVWTDNTVLTEEMTEEEKETELQYRRNEVLISKRLFLVVATNVALWLPVVMITAFAMLNVYIDPITSAWVTICVVPLNSVLNPFLFSFVVHPFRSQKDQLLLNWVEMDDEDDEFDILGETEHISKSDNSTVDGDSSMGTSEAIVSHTETKVYNKGIIGEML